MSKPNGGAAFPSPGVVLPIGANQQGAYEGMTLRDYFAAAYLSGGAFAIPGSHHQPANAAKDAYSFADAMIEERAK